jgi:hypothetical protein
MSDFRIIEDAAEIWNLDQSYMYQLYSIKKRFIFILHKLDVFTIYIYNNTIRLE